MKDLGCRHVADAEAAGDVGERTALHRRMPEGLALASRELFEHHTDEVAIGDGGLHVRPTTRLGAQRDQCLSQALAAPQQVQAVVAGDGQQPRAGRAPAGCQVEGFERDQKDFLGGVGRILWIAQDARAGRVSSYRPRGGGRGRAADPGLGSELEFAEAAGAARSSPGIRRAIDLHTGARSGKPCVSLRGRAGWGLCGQRSSSESADCGGASGFASAGLDGHLKVSGRCRSPAAQPATVGLAGGNLAPRLAFGSDPALAAVTQLTAAPAFLSATVGRVSTSAARTVGSGCDFRRPASLAYGAELTASIRIDAGAS